VDTEKLKALIEEKLGKPKDRPLSDDTLFVENLAADSLSLFELAIAIEQEFELDGDGRIPDKDIFAESKPVLRSVGDLARYIERRLTNEAIA
jgi:acyl carrier protein